MPTNGASSIPISAEAFIPTGGRGCRCGNDERFPIQQSIASLTGIFGSVSIVAGTPSVYDGAGVPVLQEASARQSPLASIRAGLEASSAPWNFVHACDRPMMTAAAIRRLARALLLPDGSGNLVAAVVPVTSSGRQPLSAFYSKRGLGSLRAAMHRGRSLQEWLDTRRVRTVHFDDETPFQSVERSDDASHLEEQRV